jgi:predicted transcriptional regulator
MRFCTEPRKVSHIIYAVKISYTTFNTATSILVENQLIDITPKGNFYRYETSTVGKKFLSAFSGYLEMFGLDQTSVPSVEPVLWTPDKAPQVKQEKETIGI